MARNNVGFTFHPIFYAMYRCLIGSLPVMKRGVFNTTRKQNDRACSGKHRIHLGRKCRHVSFAGQDHACVFLRSQADSSIRIHCKRTNCKSTVLFGNADKVTGSCSEEKTQLWLDKWILHHDNAHAPDALRFCEFLAKNFITKMDHPRYSPDLATCDFWLFPELKNARKGQRFADLSDIHRSVKTLLRGIPENNFQGCFR